MTTKGRPATGMKRVSQSLLREMEDETMGPPTAVVIDTSKRDDPDDDEDDIDDAQSLEGGDGGGPKSTSSGAASGNEGSTSDGASSSQRTGTTDEMQNIKDSLTKHETQAVFRLRVVVILILIASAAAISVTVYHIVRSSEVEAGEVEYDRTAQKIVNTLSKINEKMASVSGLAIAASGEAVSQGSEWPFVTVNYFREQANNARALSGALFIAISPIVEPTSLAPWEVYVQGNASSWIEKGLSAQDQQGLNDYANAEADANTFLTNKKVDPLHAFTDDGRPILSQSPGPIFLPVWQTTPVLQSSVVNENLFERPELEIILQDSIVNQAAVLGPFHYAPAGDTSHPDPDTSLFSNMLSMENKELTEYQGDPMTELAVPIFDTLEEGATRQVVAVLLSYIHWKSYMSTQLADIDFGYTIVLENICDEQRYYTYEISDGTVYGLGFGDRHDRSLNQFETFGRLADSNIQDGTAEGIPFKYDPCPYTFHVYPTQELFESKTTAAPVIISVAVACVFFFTIGMFLFYDRLVERRQKVVVAKATQSTAIVSSLFPKQVRDRMLNLENQQNDKRKGNAMLTDNQKLKSFLNGGTDLAEQKDQQIADLFPHCTVMFADIAGFTAWSSTREPSQVFILLQTVYQNFDSIAHRRKVFKVETIGDSYLAVTGLPEPQAKHASIMVKFAWDCLLRISQVTRELEATLGPDTSELSMRFGLHSGPVTAGVLKGDRARFQLFGDTVNTAARMESTGVRGRIQCSQATADVLKAEKREAWLTPRNDMVQAKGKGLLQTYWVTVNTTALSTGTGSTDDDLRVPSRRQTRGGGARHAQLVDWCTDMLLQQIKKVVIVHQRCPSRCKTAGGEIAYQSEDGKICLDEVQEAIHTPEFDPEVAEAMLDYQLVQVPIEITQQLREYVNMIARGYIENPFHNFEHACHVTMSVAKLLTRIVTPDLSSNRGESATDKRVRNQMAAQIHRITSGITSEPMVSLAVVFSALIHDVDHQGISNVQLGKEDPELAKHYREKSIAEQNSLDIAWDILMADQFKKMREYIFKTQEELMRFRQLIVNGVLATDIFDKELGQLRKARWDMAFHQNLPVSATKDLRATIVMEHIIQASDVSHTMQHWHVYQKWNRRLFEEMSVAFKAGRMGADPATFWYEGELGFFDNYIIPLAKKLKECNVFGVSSDEYLSYALKNRTEWEQRGKEMLANMITDLEEKRRGGRRLTQNPLDDSSTGTLSSS